MIYPVDIITQNLFFNEKLFQLFFEQGNRHCSIWYIQYLPGHFLHYTCYKRLNILKLKNLGERNKIWPMPVGNLSDILVIC